MTDPSNAATRRITIERTFAAPIDAVWRLWTTPEGIEAWWGPEGFSVAVRAMEVRAGGELRYAMTATGADQVAFMERAGMPLTTESRLTYREVVAPYRLAYTHLADFVPGVDPYDVDTELELTETAAGVRLVLVLDPMHDERWTRLAVQGNAEQLGRLARLLAAPVG